MSRPPTLLWINHFAISPAEGGGTRHFEVGRELVRRGWRVVIAASDLHMHTRRYTRRPGPEERATVVETIDGVEFRWLWSAPYERNDWRRARNWLTFARSVLRDRAGGERPDVVIGSSPHLFAAWAGARLARRLGAPFVLELRDLWPEGLLAGGGRPGPGYLALHLLARRLYAAARRVVVLARGTGRYLVERGWVDEARLAYVPNGVDPAAFAAAPAARTADAGLTLVYAGAHGIMNGLEHVLDAAHRLRDRPELRFVLVGDGPLKAELVRAAAERGLANVEFRDPVPKARMPALLAEADAGLMVLRDDPLMAFAVSPNKLFDYLAAGLPVVCNVPGEVAEMARASGAGVQAADASGAALAEAALRLAALPPGERAAMGQAGRAWVAREHGREVLAERLDAALRPLLVR